MLTYFLPQSIYVVYIHKMLIMKFNCIYKMSKETELQTTY